MPKGYRIIQENEKFKFKRLSYHFIQQVSETYSLQHSIANYAAVYRIRSKLYSRPHTNLLKDTVPILVSIQHDIIYHTRAVDGRVGFPEGVDTRAADEYILRF